MISRLKRALANRKSRSEDPIPEDPREEDPDRLQIEHLESRVLLSATWIDVDDPDDVDVDDGEFDIEAAKGDLLEALDAEGEDDLFSDLDGDTEGPGGPGDLFSERDESEDGDRVGVVRTSLGGDGVSETLDRGTRSSTDRAAELEDREAIRTRAVHEEGPPPSFSFDGELDAKPAGSNDEGPSEVPTANAQPEPLASDTDTRGGVIDDASSAPPPSFTGGILDGDEPSNPDVENDLRTDDGTNSDEAPPNDATSLYGEDVVTVSHGYGGPSSLALSTSDATALEDGSVALDITLSGATGSTTVTISGVPSGATLSEGSDNGDGSWTLSRSDLDGLTITPPAHDDADFTLTVTAESRGTVCSSTLEVQVDADADAAVIDANNVVGLEDQPIPLELQVSSPDTDGSETLSVVIRGVPTGALLSHGVDQGDGSWVVDAADVPNLSLTPSAGFHGVIDLEVEATTQEAENGDSEIATASLSVAVASPTSIPLALSAPAGSDATEVILGNVPTGATLSHGVDNGDGSWTVSVSDLPDLEVSPPAGEDEDFELALTWVGPEGPPELATSTSAGSFTFVEGLLDIHGDPWESGDLEHTYLIEGVYVHVEVEDAAGLWSTSIDPTLDMLKAVLSPGNTVDYTLSFYADPDLTEPVSVGSPQFLIYDLDGNEQVHVSGTNLQGEATSFSTYTNADLTGDPANTDITTTPDGFYGSSGSHDHTDTNVMGAINFDEPTHQIVYTFDATDSSTQRWTFLGEIAWGGVSLQIGDNDIPTSEPDTVSVQVLAQAEDPIVEAQDAAGDEDAAIALDLGAELTDTDGSETLSTVISGVPTGAVLSHGVDNGDGSWTVDPADLPSLTLTPPEDFSGTLNLSLTATSTESANGDQAVVTTDFDVVIAAVADAPDLSTTDAGGSEDAAISLTISASSVDGDGSETVSITISGVPLGATLSAGSDNGDGSWTLGPADLNGLTITPASNSGDDFSLSVTATTTESSNGDQAGVSSSINVSVNAVADDALVSTANVSGDEDSAIPLSLSANLADSDGSESLTTVITGIPAGATLSHGVDNGDGSWTVDPPDLGSLTLSPPEDFAGTISLSLVATATEAENGDQSVVSSGFTVSVNAIADAADLSTTDANGSEDTAIPLSINAPSVDDDGSETVSITISGVPSGAILSAGSDNGDGSWTLGPADLNGLTITPASNSGDDFSLSVTATTTESSNGDQAGVSSSINVSVNAVADDALVSTANVSGDEDSAIPLSLSANLADSDGSESLTTVITGIPAGATLSHGVDNGDGSWTVDPSDLGSLTLTPPEDFAGPISLSLVATATEAENGDQSVVSSGFTVSVNAIADAADLSVADAGGSEDAAIPLTISAPSVDGDGSETVSITISGVPSGAILSAGSDNGDGSWTLGPADLNGLTITPAADSGDDFSLTITASTTESSNGDQAGVSSSINVSVNAVADDAIVSTANVSGDEDSAIPLSLSANLADSDGSESLTTVITGVPAGATLSHGVDNGDGSWTVAPADLGSLTLSPPEDFAGTISLSLVATTTEAENGDQSVVSSGFTVSVNAIADAADLSVADAGGSEGNAIPLSISAVSTDADGSETVSITISGVPAGTQLSAGVDNGDGSWTLTPDQLSGLSITPTAGSGDLSLSVTATTTEIDGGDPASVSTQLSVQVGEVADDAIIAAQDVSGLEDTAIPLDLSAQLADLDGSETLGTVISGLPSGASLSHGQDNGDGSWTVDPADLGSLTLTPPEDFAGTIDLTLVATTTESGSGDQAVVAAAFTIDVQGVADDADVTVADVSGDEDSAIALSLNANLADGDGSENLTTVITGVPAGATLSHGIDNGDGSWTVDPADLGSLTLTPPEDFAGTISLSLVATTTEAENGDQSVVSSSFDVSVNAVADAADLSTTDANGSEDTAIPLTISAPSVDDDGSESVSVTISGIPAGASLSAGTDNGDGSWTLSPDQLAGLTLTPPADSGNDFSLTITATTTESSNGDQASVSSSINVSVNAVADDALITATNVSGDEDSAIALSLTANLADVDGSESLTTVITGVPSGATLSHGIDNGDGSWNVDPADLGSLTLTPPEDFAGTISLNLVATTTEAENGDQSLVSSSFDVTVNAVADAADLLTADANGSEDTAIPLTISAPSVDDDGSESVSIKIDGVPAGASLSAGHDNGDGSWTLAPSDLNGLTFTPPADSGDDFNLTITATTTESSNGDQASVSSSINVSVNAVADNALISATNVSGDEDSAIALSLNANLADGDGSENLTTVITGVPAGATLSHGIDNGDGSWTVDPSDLGSLTLSPPEDFAGTISLSLVATTTEAENGDQSVVSSGFTVSVNAIADTADLSTTDVNGSEDTAIPLTISAPSVDDDGSESVSVTIAGVPAGASLSSGHDNGDGSWTLAPDQLAGLTLTPPADSGDDFSLTITATTTESSNGDQASVSSSINVSVNAVADDALISATNVSGDEDSAIALSLTANLADVDGSESLATVITGVPSGATLSHGVDNGDGSWTVDPADLGSLTLTPPEDFAGTISLSLVATTTEAENGDQSVVSSSFDVTVNAVADAADLATTDASGSEDTAIPLTISAPSVDDDGSETVSITISGVPAGALLSAGHDNGDGSWTLSPDQLAGLTITPPADGGDDFSLTVTATTTEISNGDQTSISSSINVSVNAVADDALISATDVSGDEDSAIALSLNASLPDLDGSESLTTVITGVPSGATLSHGIDNGDGSWTVDPADLGSLTLTPLEDFAGTISLNLVATTTEAENGDQSVVSSSFEVAVNAVADAADLSTTDANGSEDTAIPLSISAPSVDDDGSESVSVTIAGVPAGASLSAGTDNGDGSWTLSPDQLAGLTLTPPADSGDDFSLTITATTTESSNGDQASVSSSINVSVNAVADDALISTSSVSGDEDAAIALSLTANLADTDGSESLSTVITGVPSGATLSHGIDNGDGSWTVDPADLGSLNLTPPEDFAGTISLSLVATTTEAENGDQSVVSSSFDVNVNAVADSADLSTTNASGSEDTAIPLSISAPSVDDDGSESVSITIDGVPAGASLSAGHDNGDGSWTLAPDQLAGLTVTPPADSGDDFSLTVTATTTEISNGDQASVSSSINVSLNAVADDALMSTSSVSGDEDAAIALSLTANLADTDGSESLSTVITGVPSGASLSHGIDNGDGSWTVDPADLGSLTLTPPEDFAGTISLSLVATTTEAENGDQSVVSSSFDVTVNAVADAANLSTTDANGSEDTAIPLSISAPSVDDDGSETVSITIAGVPTGASLSAGHDNGDGSWTLAPDQLAGLTITPPADSGDDFSLTITATTTESSNGDQTSVSSTLAVHVDPVVDGGIATTSPAAGMSGDWIPLSIGFELLDRDGSESVSEIIISGLPDGVELSGGALRSDGSWSLGPEDLANLSLRAPAQANGDFELAIAFVVTESDGSSAIVKATLDLELEARPEEVRAVEPTEELAPVEARESEPVREEAPRATERATPASAPPLTRSVRPAEPQPEKVEERPLPQVDYPIETERPADYEDRMSEEAQGSDEAAPLEYSSVEERDYERNEGEDDDEKGGSFSFGGWFMNMVRAMAGTRMGGSGRDAAVTESDILATKVTKSKRDGRRQ